MKKKPTCMTTDCGRVERSRGLCESCRVTARNEIKAGKTTEAELVELGMMQPKTILSPFRRGLENARRAQD